MGYKKLNPIIKRTITISFVALGFFIIVFFTNMTSSDQNEIKADVTEVSAPITIEVVLLKEFLDGGVSQEVKEETIWSMEDFWAKYETWNLVDQQYGKMVFKKLVDDISPSLKVNGYFGISEDGTLEIYRGNRDDVIQSFFQIDIERLESHKHKQLKEGIPIETKEQYLDVIKSFKNYSLQ